MGGMRFHREYDLCRWAFLYAARGGMRSLVLVPEGKISGASFLRLSIMAPPGYAGRAPTSTAVCACCRNWPCVRPSIS